MKVTFITPCDDCGKPMKTDEVEMHQICIPCKNKRAAEIEDDKIMAKMRCYIFFHRIYSTGECLTCLKKREKRKR